MRLDTTVAVLAFFLSMLEPTMGRGSTPPGKLIMLDVSKLSNVTSKAPTDDEHLSWQELVSAGINGVQFRSWCFSGDSGAYSQLEWVREAHQYGLWVCGGTGNNTEQMISDAAYLASLGVDFIQLDEPMGHGLTEADYNAIKARAHSVNPNCPVIITDVFYNDTIATWSQCDGLMQEVYVDQWYPTMIDAAVNYKNSHPNQDVFMWVWLLTQNPDTCTAYPDSKFDTWFTDSFNRVGKVLLFIFNNRQYGDPANCINGTNWQSRVQTMQAATANLRVALPSWRNFSPAEGVYGGLVDCSVQVRSSVAGLDPGSVRCEYSNDGGGTWNECPDVSCSGSHGSKSWETITAPRVPFSNASSTENRIRFWITDCYSGDYYRNPRTDRAEFGVNVTGLHWSGFSPSGPVAGRSPDCSINIQDSDSGLDPSTAICEYSTDGGVSWQQWPVVCSGPDGTTDKETIEASGLPFNKESFFDNKIRFSIRKKNQEVLVSKDYTVKVLIPPEFSDFAPSHTTDQNPDCSVNVQDSAGLVLGTQELNVGADTVLLLHLNGDASDSSRNSHDGTLQGGLAWQQVTSWKTGARDEQVPYFDGVDDYIEFGPIAINSSDFTISAWVQALNNSEAIVYGGVEEPGSIYLSFAADRAAVNGRGSGGQNFSLGSTPGSFGYDGKWYNVVMTLSGENIKLYLNGVLEGESTWSGFVLRPEKDFFLGRALNRPRFFKGYLDEVSLERRALSDEEISCRYHSGLYRYSTDGASTWSCSWLPAEVSGNNGTTSIETMLARDVAFGQYSDTDNVVEFMIMDSFGNLALHEFTVSTSEFVEEDGGTSNDQMLDGGDPTGEEDTDGGEITSDKVGADDVHLCTTDDDCNDGEVCRHGACEMIPQLQGQGCGCRSGGSPSLSLLLLWLVLGTLLGKRIL